MKLTEREKKPSIKSHGQEVLSTLLVVFKFIAGILGHSAAMIADAVHSLSDFCNRHRRTYLHTYFQ